MKGSGKSELKAFALTLDHSSFQFKESGFFFKQFINIVKIHATKMSVIQQKRLEEEIVLVSMCSRGMKGREMNGDE